MDIWITKQIQIVPLHYQFHFHFVVGFYTENFNGSKYEPLKWRLFNKCMGHGFSANTRMGIHNHPITITEPLALRCPQQHGSCCNFK